MARKSGNEKYAYLDQLSTEQLEELLRADFDSNDESNVDIIFHILEVIEKREKSNPSGRLPDTNKAWEEFQQFYNIPEGDNMPLYHCGQDFEKKLHYPRFLIKQSQLQPWLKTGLVAMLSIIIFFSGMVVAQAAGVDVFGAIGQWTENTFRFVSIGGSKNDTNNQGTNVTPQNIQYSSDIQSALRQCGIDETLAPTWYPEGVTISEPQIYSNDDNDTVYFSFTDEDNKFFSIGITHYHSAEYLKDFTLEKDNLPVEQYTSNSRTFYILSNDDTVTATWAYGSLIEIISGNLEINELKAIIDSIGE